MNWKAQCLSCFQCSFLHAKTGRIVVNKNKFDTSDPCPPEKCKRRILKKLEELKKDHKHCETSIV